MLSGRDPLLFCAFGVPLLAVRCWWRTVSFMHSFRDRCLVAAAVAVVLFATACSAETVTPLASSDAAEPPEPAVSTPTTAPSTSTVISSPTTVLPLADDSATAGSGAVEQYGSAGSGSGAAGVELAAGSAFPLSELLNRLEALPVQPEQRSGYDRDLFDHWVDVDGDRCDARREVLLAEAVVAPRVGASCSLSGGQWYSVYDGDVEQGTGSGFDVDHLVPLAEAWDSGARSWDADTRRRYANDLGYEHSLVAVSASSNRQKGASDPAEWLPPDTSVRCWYAEAWITVKTRWGLSVDTAELHALQVLVSQCENSQLGAVPAAASPVIAPATTAPPQVEATVDVQCHPAYSPCLPNMPGDALNCGDLSNAQKPVQVLVIGVDPYRLDRDLDGHGCIG